MKLLESNVNININSKGIGLLVLIVTIAVIIIISSAAIINLSKNNALETANNTKTLSKIAIFKDELNIYKINKSKETLGRYNAKTLVATENKIVESGVEDTSKSIFDIIPSIKETEYVNLLEIVNGELIYIGENSKNEETIISQIPKISPNIEINKNTTPTKISGVINVTGVSEKNYIGEYKLFLSTERGIYNNNPDLLLNANNYQNEYEFNNLITNEDYYIKVEIDILGIKYTKETDEIVTFEDSVPPVQPSIILETPLINTQTVEKIAKWKITSNEGNILLSSSQVTISKNYVISGDIVVNGSSTNTVMVEIPIISGNGNININIKSGTIEDLAGNKTTLNLKGEKCTIDTESPFVSISSVTKTFIKNGSVVTYTITTNESTNLVDSSKIKLTGLGATGSTVSIAAINGSDNTYIATVTGGSQNGDVLLNIEKGLFEDLFQNKNNEETKEGLIIDNDKPDLPVITTTPKSFTNGNVAVIIKYSNDTEKKEYSLDGTNWNTYVFAIIINTNNTTIYARATDLSRK